MNIKTYPFCAFLFFFFASSAWAAEIRVSPGSGTLAAAVLSAADGDTLVLEDGGFSGAVTVDKSLTIRSVNRTTNALVSSRMTIAGSGIDVTVQGLKFSVDVDLVQAAVVRLLENEWLSGDIECTNYRTSQGDGSLVIVGNRLASESGINDVHSDGAYIAGNILLGDHIKTNVYVWIVGNEIITTDAPAIDTAGTGGAAIILANRVRCNDQNSGDCIRADATSNFIASNVVEVNDTYDGVIYDQQGISAEGNGHVTVINNVIRGVSSINNRVGSAIAITTPSARIAGNVIVDYLSSSNTPITVTSSSAEVTNNLCFNNSGNCPAGEGNLNADPMFVDLVGYQLAAGSPAINAGPPDLGMADLDRTRNDMGAQGGPWSIGQYDAQRDPDNYAPYVYPLFKMDSILSGGVLEIQALGVARLR